MEKIKIWSLSVECVNGWGWNHYPHEGSGAVPINDFPSELHFESAWAITKKDRLAYVQIDGQFARTVFGSNLIIRPPWRETPEDRPFISDLQLECPALIFGNDLSITEEQAIINYFEKEEYTRKHLYIGSETRGWAQLASYSLHPPSTEAG